jgi:ATP-dependent Lhr-like helicase
MIPDERRYPVVDITTQRQVGILGDEFMSVKARPGLRFIVKGLVWEIRQIGADGTVYVMPTEDPTAAIPGWDGELIPVPRDVAEAVAGIRDAAAQLVSLNGLEGAVRASGRLWPLESHGRKRFLEEMAEHLQASVPLPTAQRIVLEGFENYLVIHSCFGDRINYTLGEIFEELLSRRGLVRFWWSDGYRVLLELSVNTRELSLQALADSLFKIDEQALMGAIRGVLHRHAPFAHVMKSVAERFGVLPRGKFVYGEAAKELWTRMRNTPVYEETVREALLLRLDFQGVREIYRQIGEGRISLAVHQSRKMPSPLAYHILSRHVQHPELVAPEGTTRQALERMKLGILSRSVDLLCYRCGSLQNSVKVGSLPDEPRCPKCGSGLMAPISWAAPVAKVILEKKIRKERLEAEEEEILARGRRAADLVLSYGKRAIVALMVHGVGPQTAARILAKMHTHEDEFYRDLLEAKIRYIATRPFWS